MQPLSAHAKYQVLIGLCFPLTAPFVLIWLLCRECVKSAYQLGALYREIVSDGKVKN